MSISCLVRCRLGWLWLVRECVSVFMCVFECVFVCVYVVAMPMPVNERVCVCVCVSIRVCCGCVSYIGCSCVWQCLRVCECGVRSAQPIAIRCYLYCAGADVLGMIPELAAAGVRVAHVYVLALLVGVRC